jgi:hypothetical protein
LFWCPNTKRKTSIINKAPVASVHRNHIEWTVLKRRIIKFSKILGISATPLKIQNGLLFHLH